MSPYRLGWMCFWHSLGESASAADMVRRGAGVKNGACNFFGGFFRADEMRRPCGGETRGSCADQKGTTRFQAAPA